jgi:hypothetical protein
MTYITSQLTGNVSVIMFLMLKYNFKVDIPIKFQYSTSFTIDVFLNSSNALELFCLS